MKRAKMFRIFQSRSNYEVKAGEKMSFTHLQVRSGYSLLNSTITIEKLVARASELQFTSLALTDENVLHGVIPFYKSCLKSGIKPLIGLIVKTTINEMDIPLVLLAKNNRGYQSLIRISTHIQMENICSYEFLCETAEDLVCILSTEIPSLKKMFLEQKYEEINLFLHHFKSIVLEEDLYIGAEIYNQETTTLIEHLKKYYISGNKQIIAFHDVRYLDKKDAISFDCLQAMKFNEKWDYTKQNRQILGRHFRSREEMETAFSTFPEIVENINEIVEKCHVTFDFTKQLLPAFPVPTNESAHDYLRKLCMDNLEEKYTEITEEVMKRLEYELHTIKELQFSDYFLIVADFVQFAKENNIMVGPGRGSAAGSIVSYLLGITNVDPLQYDLLFERFLNPERVSMPDIDIDFSDVRRDEVIDYVREKYGQDHVAQIITFGTFAARSLLRELMKTMEIDRHDQAYILKHIPVQANKPIVHYIKGNEEFQSYIKQSNKLRVLFSVAVTLEGLPRHISTHAAGIVIGKKPLLSNVPLTKGTHDTYLTQYAMNELEAIGLLKIDILGLRNLSLMERIIGTINRRTSEQLNIDLIPDNDTETFALLQAGRTNGVFQLESDGMKRVLKQLKPTSLDDIIALNALYRPGPMEAIPTYIARKHGREKIAYLHPDLEPILNNTYGVLLYQEQIMQVAHQFAGLSLGEADILRRAISKKNRQLIEQQKETFVQGCIKKGYSLQIAEEVFSWVLKFANYGFNKSHSVAYSKIAYQLSYLKANYPTFFFAHLLGTVSNDAKKLNMYVREANELGIEILPPSINKSHAYFTVEHGSIRFGLMAIKGIGYETVKEIIAERKKALFTDLFDFCLRVSIKRNALETLVLAGTFDETYDNRASLLASIDQALARAELFGDLHGQTNLFGKQMKMKPAYIKMDDFSQVQRLRDEKELMHMYVTNHPLKQYRTELTLQNFISLHKARYMNNRVIKTVAILQGVKKIHTKRGDSMAFVLLADETDEMEGVIFPNVYREVSEWLKEEAIICLEGKVSERENKKQMVIDRLQLCNVEDIVKENAGYLYVKVTEAKQRNALHFLQKYAQQFPGKTAIIIYYEKERKTYKLGEKYNLRAVDDVVSNLKHYFGDENVVLKL